VVHLNWHCLVVRLRNCWSYPGQVL